MFEKRDIIVSSTMGLCVVADITRLSADRRAPMLYYVLRSYYDTTKIAYIPVEHHEVELRKPMDSVQANNIFNDLKNRSLEDEDFVADEMQIGEIAYILKVKKDELIAELSNKSDQTD